MSAKLMPYECVPSGFEIVIHNKDVEMGKIWNLWWNVKLTDDPESWDSEIKSINKMQGSLGELSMDHRLMRAQMAEFCRLHPLFPESIDILCKEIGDARFFKPVKIGCEGRGLLDSLGYHDRRSLDKQREQILTKYVRSLEKWLQQGQPRTATEFKVFGFLGRSTDGKVVLTERLVRITDPNERSIPSLRRLGEEVCRGVHRDFKTMDRPFNCFKCLPEEASIPKCQCCYSMFLDAYLLCAGTSDEKRPILDEFRCFIEENTLVYSIAINSWLKQVSPTHVAWPENARYVSKDRASETVENISSSLGKPNEVKEWLVACLLKTIKDNQRWHKRTELIDNFPEATSWLREMP
jgi:hypothetical protein